MDLMSGQHSRQDEHQEEPGEQRKRHAPAAHLALAPNRPSGLNSNTRMNSTNGSNGAVDPGMKRAPRDSVIATMKLAKRAPMKLPMPPSTTTTNAIRIKNEPMFGTM